LEKQLGYSDGPRDRFRVVVRGWGGFETAGCRRYFCPNGTLFEVVRLDRIRESLPRDELDRWIETVPIG